jgi:putative hemolysin
MDLYWLELVVIFLLILANGFFAASEYALISARKSKIAHLVQKGSRNAKLVQQMQANPDGFVAAIQVGITLVGTLASVVGGATLVEHLTGVFSESTIPVLKDFAGSISIAVVVFSIAFLTLVVGELVPKRIGLQHAERISLSVARPMGLILKLAFIPIKVLVFTSRLVLKIMRQDKISAKSVITEDEIVQIIAEGRKTGEFSKTEQELVASVFEFSDVTVHKAMSPRTDISAISVDWPTQKAVQFVTENSFSRYPVYKDSIDNVIGLIYVRDILNVIQHSDVTILRDIMHEPFFVPDSKKIPELLRDFQRKQMHMAIVLDDFGGTAGLITLEDIIEEIVGEIQDEYDVEEMEYSRQADGSVIISSRMTVDDFNDLMGSELPEDAADTMGGFIYNHLGEIPSLNQVIEYEGLTFTVTKKTGHHIGRMSVVRSNKLAEDE